MMPASSPSDTPPADGTELARLIDAARRGDRTAQNELLTRYYPRVQRIVHGSLERKLRAHRPWLRAMFSTGDIVQEVFSGVIRDLDGFLGEDEASLVKYLATMVRNRLVDAARFHEAERRDVRRSRSASEHEGEINAAPQLEITPSSAAVLAEQRRAFQDAMESLSVRDRTLIALRLEQEEPFGRIAETMSFPSNDAARKAFVSAQARLLVKLRARGFTAEADE